MLRPETLIDPFAPAKGAPPQTLLRFIGWLLKGSFPALILAAALSALAGGMEAATAWILGRVVDGAQATGPEGFLTPANIGILALAVGFFLVARPLFFGLSSATNSMIVMPNVFTLVLSRLHRWTMGQSVTFFDNDFAGRISQKQMQTARAATDVAFETINTVAFALASLVGSAALILTIDGWLGLVFVLWLAGYLSLVRWYIPRVRARAAKRAAARAMVSGQVVDTITNIKTVKLFAHADHEDKAALGALAGFRSAALHFGRLSAQFRFTLTILAGVLPVLLVGGTLLSWTQGGATVGDIVAAGAIATRVAQMTGWVSFALMGIYGSVGEVEDGMKTLGRSVRLLDRDGAPALAVPEGEIRYRDVTFAYGGQKGGIRGIDLTIHPGEKLGIVGASGAGKSTLVSLLLRLYDPEEGRIEIDGQDIGGVTQDSLRRNIALVTQDTAMFNRSARENILYGRPDATEEEMIAAARKAEADHFIRDLKDFEGRSGYDARLGERGVKLSGGQRQRIALARAILKDAKILVLDEATSALDSEVEAQIQEALERVMEGKTVLAIAHRLSTINHMDRIVVLDQGRIAEVGPHAELLKQGGLYARYWARQSGGFIGTDETEEAAE
ncbi:ABC transporter ATP-binding protein/permease [Pseudooceanicola sp. CBS1P-1]|uniref:ATP-binding cassette domain-containing protein n=1 Tax=Pseudooceanicola albus TaxID=2692189 RepID=A0A6L7FY18_9RHOB|nr:MULTISPECIES: ABC transporter ATP-binding protein [Pseudooceanicola]MBT9383865.1 ABC transporter ATP-binding protein/permease [Pseudooceanicola endophyticus]MXN16721.1 ATP-binding cassette domain-containing protein [Pseudooceanicola albus]